MKKFFLVLFVLTASSLAVIANYDGGDKSQNQTVEIEDVQAAQIQELIDERTKTQKTSLDNIIQSQDTVSTEKDDSVEKVEKPIEVEKKETPSSEIKNNSPNTGSTEVKYYTNTDGKKVQSPTHYNTKPVGASAKCKDGTYSFSQHRSGTCSGHGGVAVWY